MNINDFNINQGGNSLFREFLRDEENKELIQELLPLIIDAVERASRENKLVALKVLFEEIEGTDLTNEPAYKRLKEKNPPSWEGSI